MNRGKRASAGYTIVETMIFLAVSAAMFLSAMVMISGRQAHAEFNNSIRDFESNMQDIANDVSDGYYADVAPNGHTIQCNASVTLSAPDTADHKGTNQYCIFIGKAVQFAPDSDKGSYHLISLVGKRLVGGLGTAEVQSYDESGVHPIAPTAGALGTPNATQSVLITGGVTTECVFYGTAPLSPPANAPCGNTPNATYIDTVTFMTTFQQQDSQSGQLKSGSTHVDLVVPSASTSLGQTSTNAATRLLGYKSTNTVLDPAGGVYICLQSNGTNQHALVSLGGENSRFSTDTTVEAGKC